jgi:hypothetical protein
MPNARTNDQGSYEYATPAGEEEEEEEEEGKKIMVSSLLTRRCRRCQVHPPGCLFLWASCCSLRRMHHAAARHGTAESPSFDDAHGD